MTISGRGRASVTMAAALALCLVAGARAEPADTTRAEPEDLAPPGNRAWPAALAPDKLQHFSLAFTLGLAFGIMSDAPAAAGGAAVLALGKELADRRRGRFDGGDLLAGVLGAGCAVLVVAALER